MNNPTTVLSNFKQLLPKQRLQELVDFHNTDKFTKSFTTENLLTTMLAAQIRKWTSLREIETGLATNSKALYHIGVSKPPPRTTIADANARIDSSVFESLFYEIVDNTLATFVRKHSNIKEEVKLIDSTTINLCLELFDWAKYRKQKGAIKIHTTLDLESGIPEFIHITNGKIPDIKAQNVDKHRLADSMYVVDRGYQDFSFFKDIDDIGGYFLIRLKKRIKYEVIGQHRVQGNGVTKDSQIRLTSDHTYPKYSKDLRMIEYYDSEKKEYYRYITNCKKYAAGTLVQLYIKRWQVELFFKWLKQNLKIKTFFGTSRNAVKNQIWTALIYFVLLKYIEFQTNYKKGILTLSRIIRESLFLHFTLIDILQAESGSQLVRIRGKPRQLNLLTN